MSSNNLLPGQECMPAGDLRIMSEAHLHIIPADPTYVPASEQIKRARDVLVSFWPDAELALDELDSIQFIDQGSNFESVRCPNCNADLDLTWWQGVMNKAAETNFENLRVVTPCCSNSTSLNNLLYHLPAGFARFVISIREPHRNLTQHEIEIISKSINCDVRIIWSHY
jgi:hypothetical protein